MFYRWNCSKPEFLLFSVWGIYLIRLSGSLALSKLARVSVNLSRAELSSVARPANSRLRTSRRLSIALSIDDPKLAALMSPLWAQAKDRLAPAAGLS
jgi:hypothetical protein